MQVLKIVHLETGILNLNRVSFFYRPCLFFAIANFFNIQDNAINTVSIVTTIS